MSHRSIRRHAIVAGGGSGGHVFPGLAVARALEARGWEVSWAGRREGIERDLVQASGLSYHSLPARAVVGRSKVDRALSVALAIRSSWTARSLIRREGASVVIGTGGYVAVPAVLGARWTRTPAFLVEPNAHPGSANRWLSRWAVGAAVGFEEAQPWMRCPSRVLGVPVREAFLQPAGSPGSTDRLTVLIVGGSQGAQVLNRALPGALERLPESVGELAVVHQVGERNIDEARGSYEGRDLSAIELEVVSFIDDMAAQMHRADLVVSRAGAITLAEICASGRPALLLPLQLAGGHQETNAAQLVRAGAALAIAPGELTDELLAARLEELLGDRERLARMGRSARRLARPDASESIADYVEEVVGEE